MKSIDELLRERFTRAIGTAFGPENITDPLIKAGDPRHADYQSNVAMPLAKQLGEPPRTTAQKIVDALNLDDLCEPPVIAGPGFINLRLKKSFLASALREAFTHANAGIQKVAGNARQTVVLDYSGPNVAKQMHVGHLRSTILGDTIARTLELLGHNVIRQNHIGDFGTQFGMLIHLLREKHLTQKPFTIEDLDAYYKQATERFYNDPAFAETARKTVVELQSGQPDAVALWNKMRDVTHAHYTELYQLLGITLTDDHERGESFYASRLPLIVDRVKSTLESGEGSLVSSHDGTANDTSAPIGHEIPDLTDELPDTQDAIHRVEDAAAKPIVKRPFAAYSEGAFCVFLPGWVNQDKNPLPMMLQKSDGGYPYSATDLAALYFRVQEHKQTPADQKPLAHDWHADRVVYFVDARQSDHFAMLFDAFRAAQWDHNPDRLSTQTIDPEQGPVFVAPPRISLEHAPFGSILGDDGKPIKTKSGESVKLKALLEESIERAGKVQAERAAELSPEKRAAVNHAVGIGAVKYADLRQDRITDYKFEWDRMLALDGNTGPYLQMQYTRVKGIYRRGSITPEQVLAQNPVLLVDHADEAALAKKLLQFPSAVEIVARDLKPHHLCNYLYELCGTFARFFESCPVLKAPSEEIKLSRLLLCHYVATTLKLGLQDLLGIPVLEEM